MLHTWGQDLQRHVHVHAVMACGVLGKEGQWHVPVRKSDFLFPVHALSLESAQAFMAHVASIDMSVCPCCKVGRLHVASVLAGQPRLPAPQAQGPP